MSDTSSATRGFLVLEDLAVLRFTGSAARDFLARQLTCDVANLDLRTPMLGAWLTAKGRALALLHVLACADGTLRAVLPAELVDDVLQRMRLFVMRDDVEIGRSEQENVLGLAGDALETADRGASGVTIIKLSPTLALAVGLRSDTQSLAKRLSAAGVESIEREEWELAQIRAGLPTVLRSTREAFVPQMLNLDQLGAVSFTKGCYPGQEIVARTQHLGRIKRRAFVAHCDQRAPLARPGDTLSVDDGEGTGKVVRAAAHEGGQELLVVLPLDAVTAGATVSLPDGAAVRVSAPPYAVSHPGR